MKVYLKHCFKSILVIFLFAYSTFTMYSQPPEYNSRGVKSLLVNYGAIRGDEFLAKFSAERFYFIDEGSPTDIKLIRKYSPEKSIAHYKDIIALHEVYEEFQTVNKDEYAFLHSAEPSSTIYYNDSEGYAYWKPDGRIGKLNIIGYRVYFAIDSLSEYKLLSNEIISIGEKIPRAKINNPNANFIKIVSVLDDSTEVIYGMPVRKVILNPNTPLLLPILVKQTASSDTNTLEISFECIGDIIPDSVFISIDTNRNKQYSASEVFKMQIEGKSVFFSIKIPKVTRSYGGYAFQLKVYSKGVQYYYPGSPNFEKPLYHYSTNINNRLKNDYYGFYVMNVSSSTWLRNYITQITNNFSKYGYNCLFEDDCIYKVSSWTVDAFTGIDYDDISWKQSLYNFMDSIKVAISPKKAYFNGLYAWGSDSLLLHSDGGMTEGFVCMHWQPYYANFNNWKLHCNLGLTAQNNYKKEWMALGGILNNDPRARMHVLCSYLLVEGELSMLGNANNYQDFAHYPEFDISLGKPLDSALSNIDELRYFYSNDSIPYYKRNFENGFVVVNPNPNKSIVLNNIEGYLNLSVDAKTTIEGGRISSFISNDTLKPQTSAIYLKPQANGNILASPLVKDIEVSCKVKEDNSIEGKIKLLACDSSSNTYKSDINKPLYIRAFLGKYGGPKELLLENDGSPASAAFSEYSGEFSLPIGINSVQDTFPILVYSTTGLAYVAKGILNIPNADSTNLVRNFSFEIDNNEDNIPDLWFPYIKGFVYDTNGFNAKSGLRSIYVKNDSLSEFRGVYISITLNQNKAEELKLSGWSKANNVSGNKDNDYSLYVDCRYNDDTPLYGQTAQFSTGTHDWEYSEKIIKPEKPIKSLTLYCLFRRHTGEVWFDHLYLGKYIPDEVKERIPDPKCVELLYNSSILNVNSNITLISFVDGHYSLTLYDYLGREICNYSDYLSANNIISYNIKDLTKNSIIQNNSIYFIKISSPCSTVFKKLIMF